MWDKILSPVFFGSGTLKGDWVISFPYYTSPSVNTANLIGIETYKLLENKILQVSWHSSYPTIFISANFSVQVGYYLILDSAIIYVISRIITFKPRQSKVNFTILLRGEKMVFIEEDEEGEESEEEEW